MSQFYQLLNTRNTRQPPPNPPQSHPPHSLLHDITPNPTPVERPIIPQPKLPPIIRQLIITPEPLPRQLVVPRPLARMRKRQLHLVRILWHHALGLDEDVALDLWLSRRHGCRGRRNWS